MDWRKGAMRSILDQRRAQDGSWGQRPLGASRVEPTALAALALLSGDDSPAARSVGRQAGDWMAGLQGLGGGLPLSMGLEQSSWPTAIAILLWSVLDLHQEERRLACGWLLDERPADSGSTSATDGSNDGPAGWPWVQGTYTWIEPTAMALIALEHEGEGGDPRALEAVAMLHERALSRGGWNAGNKAVFGRELRPQPTSTAMALLALAARGDRSTVAGHAVDYLAGALETIRSAASLGWGLLALRAWNSYPKPADGWLEQAYELCAERDPSATSHALLLLAASERGVRLMIPREPQSPAHQLPREPR